jgi:hypothetical protein
MAIRPTVLGALMERTRPLTGATVFDTLRDAGCWNASALSQPEHLMRLLDEAARSQVEYMTDPPDVIYFGGGQPFEQLAAYKLKLYLSDEGLRLWNLSATKFTVYTRERKRRQFPELFFIEDNISWILFSYETLGGRKSPFWQHPDLLRDIVANPPSDLADDYAQWHEWKREFTQSELLNRQWVKVKEDGRSYFLGFTGSDPGTYYQRAFYDQSHSFRGEWQLVGPILRLWEHTREMDVRMDVIAARDGAVHSGIECRDGRPRTYFKLLQLQN